MKKNLYILFFVLLSSCAGFQDTSLIQDKPLVQIDSAERFAPAIPILRFNNGIFYNRDTDLSKWEASHNNISVARKGSAMEIDLKDVGVDWEQLSLKFKPIDFTEAQILVIKARVDQNSKDSLKMRIDLIDEDGMMTNYNLSEAYIRSRSEFKTYKFNYNGKWTQGWPTRGVVNPKRIVEIRINFNGGGPNYTGKLFIDEIIASAGKRIIENPENYPLEDFNDGVWNWWSASAILATPDEAEGRDVMKVNLDETGPGWEGFGKKFDQPLDFSQTPVLLVRMKADNNGVLRIDLHDAKGIQTNAKPNVKDFKATNEFVDIYYDYSDRFIQSWPVNQNVDAGSIVQIACFVNPPQTNTPAFSGNLYIDEIRVLSVEEYKKLTGK